MSKHKYNKIRSKEKYKRMVSLPEQFKKMFPELSGEWAKDKIYIKVGLKQTTKPLPLKKKESVITLVKGFFKGKKK